MSQSKILSVAEDNGRSDRLAFWIKTYAGSGEWHEMKISLTNKKQMIVSHAAGIFCVEGFNAHAIDSLIDYLQQAKIFLSEEDMVARLMGTK